MTYQNKSITPRSGRNGFLKSFRLNQLDEATKFPEDIKYNEFLPDKNSICSWRTPSPWMTCHKGTAPKFEQVPHVEELNGVRRWVPQIGDVNSLEKLQTYSNEVKFGLIHVEFRLLGM